MASSRLTPLQRISSQWICPRCAYRLEAGSGSISRTTSLRSIRQNSSTAGSAAGSTESPPPALLSKIKGDLKNAMRAKDSARLNVLRAIISETNQLASGPNPVRTDLQLLSLLKKRKAASKQAAQEAADAKRDDLKEKQEKEIEIVDEYAGSVQMIGEEEVKPAVEEIVKWLKGGGFEPKQGVVIREVLKEGGPLDGKNVDKKMVADVVKQVLSSES